MLAGMVANDIEIPFSMTDYTPSPVARLMLRSSRTPLDQAVTALCVLQDVGGRGKRTVLKTLLRATQALLRAGEPVPSQYTDTEVIRAIDAELSGSMEWKAETAKRNAKRKADAAREQSDLQRRADEIWQRNPRLSRTAVAKLIDRKRWNAIRRKITPLK
jgi:hypothetical protein